jgi:hypothetical protein
MFESNFDPLHELEQLAENQKVLFNNDQELARALELLRQEVRSQQEVIDVLIKGLNAANKANQELLTQGLDRLYTTFNAQGQH